MSQLYSPPPPPKKPEVKPPPDLPTAQQLIAKDALNVLYSFDPRTQRQAVSYLLFPTTWVSVDAYCPTCKSDTVFQGDNTAPVETEQRLAFTLAFTSEVHTYTSRLLCSRNRSHFIDVAFEIGNTWFRKFGQWPTIADLAGDHFREYRAVLSPERLSELNRAVGLFSHDIGIGSFVYLRRTFEWLVSQAESKAVAAGTTAEPGELSQRMEDRIKRVEHYLPEFLVENRAVYGILSKGIHELSEDECKRYFPTVRAGIEVILDAHLADFQKLEKQKAARAAIQSAQSEMAGE